MHRLARASEFPRPLIRRPDLPENLRLAHHHGSKTRRHFRQVPPTSQALVQIHAPGVLPGLPKTIRHSPAKSVYDYLITTEGIQANRLSFKGYGETMPIVSDKEITTLSSEQEKEKAHQKNRRTVYKILM